MQKLRNIKGKFFAFVGLIVLYFAFKDMAINYFNGYTSKRNDNSKISALSENQLREIGKSAASLLGSYLFFTREFPEFCKTQGIDVEKFVKDYKKTNAILYADATTVLIGYYKSVGVSYSEDIFYNTIKSKDPSKSNQDINKLVNLWKVDYKGLCQKFNKDSIDINGKLRMDNTFPGDAKNVRDNYKNFLN